MVFSKVAEMPLIALHMIERIRLDECETYKQHMLTLLGAAWFQRGCVHVDRYKLIVRDGPVAFVPSRYVVIYAHKISSTK